MARTLPLSAGSATFFGGASDSSPSSEDFPAEAFLSFFFPPSLLWGLTPPPSPSPAVSPPPAAVLRERVDGLAPDLFALAPSARRVVAREQAAARARQQAAARGSVERADEVALGLRRDLLDAYAARVVAADAARRAEPDDALAVDEDRVHTVRAQAARRAREREVLGRRPIRAEAEDAAPVRRRVKFPARRRGQGRHGAGRARHLQGAREPPLVNAEESAVAGLGLRAEVERPVRAA